MAEATNGVLGAENVVSSAAENGDDERSPSPQFKPLVDAQTLPVTEGAQEVEEEVLLNLRAKLWRMHDDGEEREWKERGVGTLKVLEHKSNSTLRVLMRRDKTFKVCANHLITPYMRLEKLKEKNNFFIYKTYADQSDDGEAKPETFLIKFINGDEAKEFQEVFEMARDVLKDIEADPTPAKRAEEEILSKEESSASELDEFSGKDEKLSPEEEEAAAAYSAASKSDELKKYVNKVTGRGGEQKTEPTSQEVEFLRKTLVNGMKKKRNSTKLKRLESPAQKSRGGGDNAPHSGRRKSSLFPRKSNKGSLASENGDVAKLSGFSDLRDKANEPTAPAPPLFAKRDMKRRPISPSLSASLAVTKMEDEVDEPMLNRSISSHLQSLNLERGGSTTLPNRRRSVMGPSFSNLPPYTPPPDSPSLGDEDLADALQCSRTVARRAFQWLISPQSVDKFLEKNWEKRPVLIRRHRPDYYKNLLSCKDIDRALRRKNVFFEKNLDITIYEGGERQTHTPAGRAVAHVVWDYFRNGCSVRMLNPQTFFQSVWKLNSVLAEYFNSFVGANVYLTPAGTQGFAPHFDDIEAFVLQLEGKKRWKVYKPLSEDQKLPVLSSRNLSQDEIGEPVLESVLVPGDLLYFPRGFVHQAEAVPETHSLHITVSCAQRHSYGELLKKLLPAALERAMKENVEFRESLPLDYSQVAGLVNAERFQTDESRIKFFDRLHSLIAKLPTYAPIDAVVDEHAKRLIKESLPPLLSEGEKACSIFGIRAGPTEDGDWYPCVELESDTEVRLIRHGCCRVVEEGDKFILYYTIENSREYEQWEPGYLELAKCYLNGVIFLTHSYPEYIAIKDLPLRSKRQHELATTLWEKGLLMTKSPLEAIL